MHSTPNSDGQNGHHHSQYPQQQQQQFQQPQEQQEQEHRFFEQQTFQDPWGQLTFPPHPGAPPGSWMPPNNMPPPPPPQQMGEPAQFHFEGPPPQGFQFAPFPPPEQQRQPQPQHHLPFTYQPSPQQPQRPNPSQNHPTPLVIPPQAPTPEDNTSAETPAPSGTPLKHHPLLQRTRTAKACTFCVRRKIRCLVKDGRTSCTSCEDRAIPCSFVVPDAAAGSSSSPAATDATPAPTEASSDRLGDFTMAAREFMSSGLAREEGGRPAPPAGGQPPAKRKRVSKKSASTIDPAVVQPAASTSATPTQASRHVSAGEGTALTRLMTPYDDLEPLPSLEIQNLLFARSFEEAQAAVPFFHRPTLREQKLPHYVIMALQALSGATLQMPREADAFYRRAARDVVPSLMSMSAPAGEILSILQAALTLMIYCFMTGKTGAGAPDARWLSLSVACARQIRLNEEMDHLDPVQREIRRRVWWYLFICDGIYSTAADIFPTIHEQEARGLRVIGNETAWTRNIPLVPSDSVAWRDVIDALDGLPHAAANNVPTPNSSPPDQTEQPPLVPYWARTLASIVLLRRGASLSRNLWRPGHPPPDFGCPDLRAYSDALQTWRQAHLAFHTVGDGQASSAGDFRRGDFIVFNYHVGHLLAYSPRFAIDRLIAPPPAPPPAQVLDGEPLLAAWAASAHATICRWHLAELAGFLESVLQSTHHGRPASSDKAPPAAAPPTGAAGDGGPPTGFYDFLPLGGIPSAPTASARGRSDSPHDQTGYSRTHRFYDQSVGHLGIFQWHVSYAALVQTVLDALEPANGAPSHYATFERSVSVAAGFYGELGRLWKGVAAVRAALLVRGLSGSGPVGHGMGTGLGREREPTAGQQQQWAGGGGGGFGMQPGYAV
ncbi:hypothetical protein HDU96_002972 [Phlyctochytrium bullatum]|nr:hypothetical protein HDU96_002972 [Phlyctochytrium bullatum]